MTIPYATSKDYPLLLRLMKEGKRVACFVDYHFSGDSPLDPPCRDICATRSEEPNLGSKSYEVRQHWYLAVQSRGYCHIGGHHISDDVFLAQCAKANLEFIIPTL